MDREVPHPNYDSLQFILGAIAQWIRRYRQARATRHDLMNCSTTDVANMARELKITPDELATLARKGPNSADLLQKLLIALGVDPNGVEHDDPLVMRDLQRLCTTCSDKRRCELDIANEAIADKFHDYCPNTFTIDAILRARQ
jgi:hypothetical protein